jgi:hypothetical membrane protein
MLEPGVDSRPMPSSDAVSARDRSVRAGGLAFFVGAVQFVIAMVITQLGWTTPYSLSKNYISDLGAAHCGYWTGVDPRYICSPWHLVFDTSIVILGLLSILGAYLIRSALRTGWAPALGLVLFALSGVGAIGVGLSPEDVDLTVHTASALTSFVASNTALILLGISMIRDPRWRTGFGSFGVVLGFVGWLALVLFVSDHYLGIGVGGMERLIVCPTLLWAAVIGVQLVRGRFRPPVPSPVTVAPTGV